MRQAKTSTSASERRQVCESTIHTRHHSTIVRLSEPPVLSLSFKSSKVLSTGPRVAKGTTVSASKNDDHNVELTYKLKGKTTETDKFELSADGKTLTQTVTYPSVSKPEVDVYDRE
jgi:hypothetical protein